ncbi:MAG TPA: iron-containing redox enzyme family protein [Solirubrobacteraceae bacterium]|nr:iron-containing redox enzyme family protein [Solirubrobacteraceae bacterium]
MACRVEQPRGPVSEALRNALLGAGPSPEAVPVDPVSDPLADEDLQLALYWCYELHYRGLEGVDDRWEWAPALLALRARLEEAFEGALLSAVGAPGEAPTPDEVDGRLRELGAEDGGGRSLSRHLEREATVEQMREFLAHRSAYQLKEADPHSWALPRLYGGPKAALVEIQADEYGGGRAERIHAELFAARMRALGLDDTYGAYVGHLPATTLATVNLMSFLGLHRRLRGALVGHLALFETTSPIPNRRYAQGLRRLGFDDEAATGFFVEHVHADAVHEAIACVDLAAGLARQQPALAADILWGARALGVLEGRWSAHLLDAWAAGRSSLRSPLGPPVVAAI